MSLSDLASLEDSVALLQRSLERGRLGHAYLFHGADLGELETVARTLAKTVNCTGAKQHSPAETPLDSCDQCLSCRKIDGDNHPDVMWIRPESKSRVITIDQMVQRKDSLRPLLPAMHLKPTEARYKVGVIVSADRLNESAANAFLKTLEEPPSDSILILLTTELQRILDTILSRCLRLSFGGEAGGRSHERLLGWLDGFAELAASDQKSLLVRYNLLSSLLTRLAEIKKNTAEAIASKSPLESHDDVEAKLKEKWEDELSAAVEAEYRRERTELLSGVQWWLRDVWLQTLALGVEMATFPGLGNAASRVARRISTTQAMENLQVIERTQRLLATNVQEALALEVGLLKLNL